MKLWGGRFKEDTDELMDLFNASIDIDSLLYKEDIEGSLAHVQMLEKIGIVNSEECDLIKTGLRDILLDIENGDIEFSISDEDIHMFIERLLIEKIGEVGKKLHTARSRNDQTAVDLRLYVKKEISKIKLLIHELMTSLYKRAKENTEVIMPGYTHLQRAQPIRLSFYLMAYFSMLKRDYIRFDNAYKLMDELPLGAGALAGTSYETDREFLRDILGFEEIMGNALDAVSDRDYVIETSSNIALGMMHLSRIAEEIVIFSSKEFDFFTLSDKYSTGSSIMPQKKNPDAAELIRGKTGSVYGNLLALLVMMKGLPLAYNKDMQEDKKQIFEAIDNFKISLSIMSKMIQTMIFNKTRMFEATQQGFLNATDLADYLVTLGIPFRKSHEIVGSLVAYAIANNLTLEEIALDKYQEFVTEIDQSVYDILAIENCVESKKSMGSTNMISTLEMLGNAYNWLEENR
ncbi:MAG: argininosuccinate lyase [Clostridiales bacterium]|nr:argininosuccinate lyase [Clostridiales bacterium]